MGYRSEVALAVTTDAATLLKILSKHNKDLEEILEEGITIEEWREDYIRQGHTIVFEWGDIKWYTDAPGVKQLEDFMIMTDETEWRFARVGESADDSVIDGQFYDSGLYISRSITRC